ncbi:hypothetical protein [Chryseobacterium tongliaoense]|uniref:hypothetical protein n=1 Tax=Chryseobacterium tongliaoense TaxID=3240933 RepID=UPI003513CA16
MQKIISGIIVALLISSCSKEKPGDRLLAEPDQYEHLISENAVHINKEKIPLKKDFLHRKVMNGLMKSLIHSDILLKISN